jgi:hypothetical protein
MLAVVAPGAYASCGTEAKVSPYAFVGTVIDTDKQDRIATVITDSGRQVTVVGILDGSWFPRSFSSADRRYALGGRYEFHPTNADYNSCTATQQLAGPRLRPLQAPTDFYRPGCQSMSKLVLLGT